MSGTFQAVPIADRVYWVGAVDWALRDFHGYRTGRGTSYNAYLVLGDPVVLIDAVKAPFLDELLSRVASVIDPAKIDVVVSNHAEMDHTGGLPELLARVRPRRVLASAQGVQALQAHFHWQVPVEAVREGDALDLGDRRLQFASTPMLHWPDSMFSYLEGPGILFSNDGFGMHLASAERFADELGAALCREEAAKYYANIMLPFSGMVEKLLQRLPGLGWDIRQIAPDHGPIWRRDPRLILDLYRGWAAQSPTRKALVVYATMWGSTARMATAVGEGLLAGGASARLMPLSGSHRSDIATEILEAGALVVGSPTINGQIFPEMADVLVYLKGLRRRGLAGGAFGSHGWSGEGTAQLEQWLEEMKITRAANSVRAKYVPDEETLARCRDLGRQVAAHLAHTDAAPRGSEAPQGGAR